jgi:hypothetical protein
VKFGVRRMLLSGRPARLLHSLPLTHSLKADVGPDLPFARSGASAVVDCHGSLQITLSNEARFWGARRVENKITDETFASGWTLGTNVTKTLSGDTGPYLDRLNVYSLARSSGTGVVLTLNSTTYRPGQHTFSVWLGGNGSVQYTLALQRSSDSAVLGTVTVTPPASGLTRYAVFGEIEDTTNHRVQISSTTAVQTLRLSCPQMEWTHGQNGAPNDYVPRGNSADVAPYHGANVDGVRYFPSYNPWTVASGVATLGAATNIPAADLKGHIVGPTRVNKFYESRDIGAASWTLTNATAAGAMIDSTLLGSLSLRKLEETTGSGLHRATQTWKGTLPSNNVMVTVAAFVPTTVAERAIMTLGFLDKAGAEKKVYVNVNTQTVLTESGDTYMKTHITLIGDLLRISFTATSGTGAGTPEGFVGLATADNTESYAGTAGSGMYFGGLQFERTDHACIYLGDTATSTPAGTGDDTNTPSFDFRMGANDWTVMGDFTPMFDSDSPTKSSWTYMWYATVASNLRWGCGIRPGAFGGAVVEDYVKHPVFDCYAGPDGIGVPQINPNTQEPQEIFDVCNLQLFASALTTKRWQIALHKRVYDGVSNIAMHVGSTQGVLDSNGTRLVSKVPLDKGFKLAYKNTPIDEKCVKNFKVITKARTWGEMAADAA